MKYDENKHNRGADGRFVSKRDTTIERLRAEFLHRKKTRQDNTDKRDNRQEDKN